MSGPSPPPGLGPLRQKRIPRRFACRAGGVADGDGLAHRVADDHAVGLPAADGGRAGGIGNVASALASPITINTITLPEVTIAADAAVVYRGQTARVVFTLTENSTDFGPDDVTVGGGQLTDFVGSGTTYSATVIPAIDSTSPGSIPVAPGRFTSPYGQPNVAGSLVPSILVDTRPQAASISVSPTTLIAGQTASVTFSLIAPSTDFEAADVTITGGTLCGFTGSAATYSGTFTPDSNSTTPGSISIAGGTFSGPAGNANVASTLALPIIIDTVRTTVVITSSTPTLRIGQTAVITFTLTEAATDFTAADVAVTGGTLSGFAGSGTSYTATFTPATNSTAAGTVAVAAGVFNDAAGNGNLAGQLTPAIAIDTAAPAAPALALGSGVGDGATAAEATAPAGVVTVTGESGAAITVSFTRGLATVTKNLVGTGGPQGVVLTAGDLATLGDGPVTVSATQTDVAGNPQAAGPATVGFTLDTAAAGVAAVTSPVANGTVVAFGQTVKIRVAFNEDVAIDVSGGSPVLLLNTLFGGQAAFVRQADPRSLVFSFTPSVGDEAAALDVAGATALVLNGAVLRDTAGNTAEPPVPVGSLAARRIAIDASLRATATSTAASPQAAPRFVVARQSLVVTFNAPVTGVTLASFRLLYAVQPTRSQPNPAFRPISLRGARVTGSGTTYVLTLPRNLTNARGTYRLDVGGPGALIAASSGQAAMPRVNSLYWKRV